MEGIVLGQFVPGNSILHRLDPRVKVISSLLLLPVIVLLQRPAEYAGFGLSAVILYVIAGVTGSIFRVLKPGFYLVAFTLFINMVFTPGEMLVNLGIISVSREGLVQGLTIGARLIFLISVSSLVTLTTSPVRMTDGMQWLLRPFRRAGLPVNELAMMMNIALRFIPSFLEETDKIKKAQVSRGADFASRNPGKRIKYLMALLVPLFVSAFRKAEELSVAMESRGYVVGMKRTSLYRLQFHRRDYVTLMVLICLAAGFIAFRYFC